MTDTTITAAKLATLVGVTSASLMLASRLPFYRGS